MSKPIPASKKSGRKHIGKGIRIAGPLVIGYVPVAVAFGVVATVSGLPVWASIAMSALVYGGASQFAALQLLGNAASLGSIVLTTFIINLRHLLLAASIAPKLEGMSTTQKSLFSVELTDEAYAVHDAEYRRVRQRHPAEVFTTNVVVHISWILGTVLGVVLGEAAGGLDDLGLEFALTAMFIAILCIDAIKSRHDLWVAILSGGTAVGLTLSGLGVWATVVSTMFAATVGWIWTERSIGITEVDK